MLKAVKQDSRRLDWQPSFFPARNKDDCLPWQLISGIPHWLSDIPQLFYSESKVSQRFH